MVDATRDMILDCEDIELVKVTVPYWKDKDGNKLDVYIKQFSAKDGEEYMSKTDDEGVVTTNQLLKSIAVSVCHSDGTRMFKKEDVERLADKNMRALAWLGNKIVEINFATPMSVEEEAKK